MILNSYPILSASIYKTSWRNMPLIEGEEGKTHEFSGVNCPKSAAMMAALDPLMRRGLSVQVPKYFFPNALNFLSTLSGVFTAAVCGSAMAKVDVSSARQVVRKKVDFIVIKKEC